MNLILRYLYKKKIIIINHNFFVSLVYDIEQNFKKDKLNDDPKIKLLKYPNKNFRCIKFSEISDKLFILSNLKKKIVVLLREFFFFNEKKTIILGVF